MSNVKVTLNSVGIRELLKSEAVSKACLEQAEQIKREVGTGFEIHEKRYPERTGYAVSAESKDAIKQTYQDNVLLKAVGRK